MAVACGSKIVDRSRSQVFKYDRWCTALVAQVLSALKGRMGAGGPGRPGADDARDHQTAGGRTVHPRQKLRAPAAAVACPDAQPRGAAVAGADGTMMARLGRQRHRSGGRSTPAGRPHQADSAAPSSALRPASVILTQATWTFGSRFPML